MRFPDSESAIGYPTADTVPPFRVKFGLENAQNGRIVIPAVNLMAESEFQEPQFPI